MDPENNFSEIKTGYLDINCTCIDNCTDESRYIDKESHFIHIPRDIYHKFLILKKRHGRENFPLYVGVRNIDRRNEKLYFGRVEPSVNSANSNHEMALLPKWVCTRLGIDEFLGKIDIVYVPIPQPIKYMKIRGNNSSYVKSPDIKLALENKLGQYNCINLNENFYIDDVIFTVTELKNKDNMIIEFGSIFDQEVNIDFELPDDLKEENEKRLKAEQEIKNRPPRELQKAVNNNHKFGADVHGFKENETEEKKTNYVPFSGNGLILSSTKQKPLTREELLQRRLAAIEVNKDVKKEI